jgi:hypothetical protein
VSLKEAETSPDWYQKAHVNFQKVIEANLSRYHATLLQEYPDTCGCARCLALIPQVETKDVFQIFKWFHENEQPYFFTLSKDNPDKFSYSKKDGEQLDYTKRQIIALRRFMKRNCGFEPLDVAVNKAETIIIEELKPIEWYFQRISGGDIKKAYHLMVGGRSCMTKNEGEYVTLYGENPECVYLLVGNTKKDLTLEQMAGNKASMRCLIWDTGTHIVADRIYRDGKAAEYSYEDFQARIEKWIATNHPDRKIVMRSHHKPHTAEAPAYDLRAKFEVQVKEPSNGKWPYIDSFRFARINNTKDRFILSTCPDGAKWTIATEAGTGPRLNSERCSMCARDYSTREAGSRDKICARCVKENFYTCHFCNAEHNQTVTRRMTIVFDRKEVSACAPCHAANVRACQNCGYSFRRDAVKRVCGRRSHYCAPCIQNLGYREVESNAAAN